MRRLWISTALLCSTLLASCGGGGNNPLEVIQIASVTRSVLVRCLQAPSSLDEVLLGCLAGTVSTGVDASGKSCTVSFSSSLLQIVSTGYQGSIPYQRGSGTGARDTTYVYDRFYDPKTGAFKFAVSASNAGAAYFGFSFSNDPAGDSGSASFGFEVAPAVPGAPAVAIKCAVRI
jgi:hypothetical protein